MDFLLQLLDLFLGNFLELSVLTISSFAIILIFKTSTTTNFAQGMVSATGAFLAANLFSVQGFPLWLSIVLGMLAGLLMGVIIDFGIIRRAKVVTPVGKQMITMGLVLILLGLVPTILLPNRGGGSVNLEELSHNRLELFDGRVSVTYHYLIAFLFAVVLLTTLFLLLKFSRWGLAVRATANNENIAKLMGVNTHFITAISWSIAGAIGSLAAILLVSTKYILSSSEIGIMTPIQVQGFLAAVFGGFQTFHGPVLGAIIIALSNTILSYYLSEWAPIIVYLLVLVSVLIKPLGLFGKKVVKKV